MKNFILIDTETTGLHPGKCEITEIGAIKVDGETLEVIDTYSTLVDIEGDVPYFITKLTGITKRMLDNDGISMSQALSELSVFCGDLPMYAHNASFDKRFVRYFLEKESTNFVSTDWIDTIGIFKSKWPGRKTYKLESLMQDFGLADKEDHRAVSDAMFTLKLMKL